MIRYLEDYEEQCKRCKGECGVEGMSGSIVCHGFVPKTNADRIRAMTDEELVNFFWNWCEGVECKGKDCDECIEIWLKQECDS